MNQLITGGPHPVVMVKFANGNMCQFIFSKPFSKWIEFTNEERAYNEQEKERFIYTWIYKSQ